MTPEQKQRAKSLLDCLAIGIDAFTGDRIAALLRELIDAPEQAVGVPDCWPTDEMVLRGAEQLHDLGIQCETEMQQDIVESVFKAMLAAAPEAPEAPAVQADMVKDAERYRWLRTYNTAKHPAVTEAFFLGDENLDAEIDAAIAAEKGGAA